MQSRPQRLPGGRPKRLSEILERKTRAAQQMRAQMGPPPAKRLPGHGHRVHGR